MPGKQYTIMWTFFISLKRANFSYLKMYSYETTYSIKMPYEQHILGVSRKIYIKL